MPKLSDLLAERAKGEVIVGGSRVEIVFFVMRRERFTDDEWAQILALTGREYLKVLLPKVIVSWDIVDDSGTMIPITPESFDQYHVPDVLLFAMEQRVFGSDLSGKVISSNSHGT